MSTLLDSNQQKTIIAYQFRSLNGSSASGNLLTPGSNQITLTPCPPGITSMSVTFRCFVYISNGTGTAEAVPITAFSASGANATITVTTANAHSGAWTVTSASSGIQEAAVAIGMAGTVFLPPGSIALHGTCVLSGKLSLAGTGVTPTIINVDAGVAPAIVIADNIGSGTGYRTRHSQYTLQGGGSGKGIWLGGDPNNVFAPSTWYGDGVRFENVISTNFDYGLTIFNSDFSAFYYCNFGGTLSGGVGLYLPSGGGSKQPLEFYGTTISSVGTAIQMDDSNFGAAYILFIGGQISGKVDGADLHIETHGTHYEPNVGGQPIMDVTASCTVRVVGGLMSAHPTPSVTQPFLLRFQGANSNINIQGTYIQCDVGQTVTTYAVFSSTTGQYILKNLHVAPAGVFTNLYTAPGSRILNVELIGGPDTVVAGATITWVGGNYPQRTITQISGGTVGGSGITAVAGLIPWQYGILTTTAAQTFTAGATIGNTITTVANVPYTFYYDGTHIWIH